MTTEAPATPAQPQSDVRWFTEGLRATAFYATPPDIAGWWKAATGEEPETEIREKGSVAREEGDIGRWRLIVGKAAGRVDWLLGMRAPQGTPEFQTDFLGPFPETLNTFCGWIERWAKGSPPARRLALGTTLVQPAQDLPAALRQLSRYLPSGPKVDDGRATEFFLQVNRTRISSSVPGLLVNRVTKWTIARFGGGIGIQPGVVTVQPGTPFPTVEMDINSAGDWRKDMGSDEMSGLFLEFRQLAVEISEKGDVP